MLTADQKTELTTLIELTLKHYTGQASLLRMLESTEPVEINDATTMHYQKGPAASAVEKMIEFGLVIAAETGRWWPSQLDALSEIIQAWPTRLECVGHTIWMTHSGTGNRCCSTISEPTVQAVEAAVKDVKADMRDCVARTRKQRAGERSINTS